MIGHDETRDKVIANYRPWVAPQPALLAAFGELRDKHLVCWCAPQRCQGEVLFTIPEILVTRAGGDAAGAL